MWGEDDLPADTVSTVHISSATDLQDCGIAFNEAFLTVGGEPAGSEDAAEEVSCPNIDVDKTTSDEDGVAGPGQTVHYDIAAYVLDGEVAGGVVTDTLPVGQTYVDGSQTSSPEASSFEISPDGRTLTWTFDTTLSGDPAATMSYDVTIDEGVETGSQTNSAEFCVVIGAESLCDSDEETIDVPALTIEKSVDGNTGGTGEGGVPLAIVGDTLTYTLDYTLENGPVNNGVITDVIPAGLEYVVGSALDNAEFTFQGATANVDGTTTLEWTAPTVTADGSLSYQVAVQPTAERDAALVNVATIHSDETPPDDDDQTVTVPESPVLTIEKTNDAPVETLVVGDETFDLPTLEEGESATFTLRLHPQQRAGHERCRHRRPARGPGLRRRHGFQQRRVHLRRLRRGDPDAALGGRRRHEGRDPDLRGRGPDRRFDARPAARQPGDHRQR